MPTTSTDAGRRAWLLRAGSAAFALGLPARAFAQATALHLEMWSHEGCGCCNLWAGHMRSHGFAVTQRKVGDVGVVRKQLGMPEKYAGCHVARVGRYAIDGHVPALDVLALLRRQPRALGLAVPDMPVGSPGMEQGGRKDPYQVLLIGLDAGATVFNSYL